MEPLEQPAINPPVELVAESMDTAQIGEGTTGMPIHSEEPAYTPLIPVYAYAYLFEQDPHLICSTGRTLCTRSQPSNHNDAPFELNFCKSLKWSPDGTCLLTSTNDNMLRVFETPTQFVDGSVRSDQILSAALAISEAESVYDYSWYPHMKSADPSTCCLVTSIRDHPIRLWDAYSGQLRCTYSAFDHLDQVQAPNSLAFNLDGSKIYCGFNNLIQIFQTNRPGRECVRRPTTPTRKSRDGQKGLISTITFNPDCSGLYAAGSYSNSIGLYDERNDELLYLLRLESGAGVTQVEFSLDGMYLYSTSRKSNEILCWDIRNSGDLLGSFKRKGDTNQRLAFHLDPSGRYMTTGDEDGNVLIYNIKSTELLKRFKAHQDTVSAAAFHPTLPMLASCSGQRRDTLRANAVVDPDGCIAYIEDEEGNHTPIDNSIAIRQLPYTWEVEGQSVDITTT